MSLIQDVTDYEAWLATQCNVVQSGLDKKHKRMRGSSLRFFRATCFRFARQITTIAPDLADAPKVISVGDAHIENFGTWRDKEGRLVWGVNDFDEAARLPYTYDLVRLSTSARLVSGLSTSPMARAEAILEGYQIGLANPAPCFVNEGAAWMVKAVATATVNMEPVSKAIAKLEDAKPPNEVKRLLRDSLPDGAKINEFGSWEKGGGSLGRPRYVAVATWQHGPAVREAKALVPSAWTWAAGKQSRKHLFKRLAEGCYRSPDPFLDVEHDFIVRRVANDATKIELSSETIGSFEAELFCAMGRDLAAVHLGEGNLAAEIAADILGRGAGWLDRAAASAATVVEEDYATWLSWSSVLPSVPPNRNPKN